MHQILHWQRICVFAIFKYQYDNICSWVTASMDIGPSYVHNYFEGHNAASVCGHVNFSVDNTC